MNPPSLSVCIMYMCDTCYSRQGLLPPLKTAPFNKVWVETWLHGATPQKSQQPSNYGMYSTVALGLLGVSFNSHPEVLFASARVRRYQVEEAKKPPVPNHAQVFFLGANRH
jgi:hypothetical protein